MRALALSSSGSPARVLQRNMRVRRCWSRAAVTLAFVSAVFASIGCAGQSAVPAAAPVLTLQQDGTPRPLDFPGSELPGSEPTGFERVATVGGVEVFEQSGVPFISIAGQGRFPAPPAVVQKVLLDFPRHAQVLERLADCEVLERGAGRMRIYQRLALPVVDDRDYALDVTWGQGEAWKPAGSVAASL